MKRLLRGIGITLVSVVGLALIAFGVICLVSERVLHHKYPLPPALVIALPADPASIAEGRRLASVHGCFGDCHGEGGQGAVMFDDPMIARIVAPSLSAAARKFSTAQLDGIIRYGIRPDGRSVMVMPSESFATLRNEDFVRIVAFLQTLPDHSSVDPGLAPGITPGPVGRLGLAIGKFRTAANLMSEPLSPPDTQGGTAVRGRYLAMTVCGHCHGRDLRGNTTPAYVAPSLRIIDAYSPDAFRQLLRTGVAIGNRNVGIMSATAKTNLAQLTDEEIAAIDGYLRNAAL